MTIGPKGGPLGKNFFKTSLYQFKMIVLMKKNVFDGFKAIFKHGEKFSKLAGKKLRVDHRTKGGTIGKNFFQNMSLSVQNDCFDEKKRF